MTTREAQMAYLNRPEVDAAIERLMKREGGLGLLMEKILRAAFDISEQVSMNEAMIKAGVRLGCPEGPLAATVGVVLAATLEAGHSIAAIELTNESTLQPELGGRYQEVLKETAEALAVEVAEVVRVFLPVFVGYARLQKDEIREKAKKKGFI